MATVQGEGTSSGTMMDIVSGMQPNYKAQQEEMYRYLLQNNQRMGVAGGAQYAAQAVAPYAAEASQTAGNMALEAAEADEKARQFDEQQALYEAQFEEQKKQNEIANQLAMFQSTGWTPELLEALGYGDLSGTDMNDLNRLLEDLGFTNPSTSGNQSASSQSGVPLGHWNNWGGQTGLIYG